MACPFADKLTAFHDRELSPADEQSLRDHLAQCPECQSELAGLADLSHRLATATIPPASSALKSRLRRQADQLAGERGILRLAELLTAAASIALVVGLINLAGRAEAHSEPTAAWEQAAVTLQAPRASEPELTMMSALGGIATGEDR